MGVRSSWLVVARNRSLASSSSLAAVTSRKSMTSSPPPSASEVHRTSSQRPLDSLWVSVEPGSGSGNEGGLPMASWAGVPVIRRAAGFHCRTRPASSSTAMPSALPLADQGGRQRGGPPAQPGRQAGRADQPERVVLDEHEAARVGAGQLAQAGRDAVEHGLEIALRVHVGDHVAETAYYPGPFGHIVPGHVVFPSLVADVYPA